MHKGPRRRFPLRERTYFSSAHEQAGGVGLYLCTESPVSLTELTSCGLLILRNGLPNKEKVSASSMVDLPVPFVPRMRVVECSVKDSSVN